MPWSGRWAKSKYCYYCWWWYWYWWCDCNSAAPWCAKFLAELTVLLNRLFIPHTSGAANDSTTVHWVIINILFVLPHLSWCTLFQQMENVGKLEIYLLLGRVFEEGRCTSGSTVCHHQKDVRDRNQGNAAAAREQVNRKTHTVAVLYLPWYVVYIYCTEVHFSFYACVE